MNMETSFPEKCLVRFGRKEWGLWGCSVSKLAAWPSTFVIRLKPRRALVCSSQGLPHKDIITY